MLYKTDMELPKPWSSSGILFGNNRISQRTSLCTSHLQLLHRTFRITGTVNIKLNHIPGPRNWQPLALTAAHRLEDSCWGFWCWRMSSVTVRSPKDRAALIARILPSSSTSWQWTRVTSFLCIGRLRTLWVVLFRPTPLKESKKLFLGLQCSFKSPEKFPPMGWLT